jgi:hypothetical protein
MEQVNTDKITFWQKCMDLLHRTYYFLRPINRKRLSSFKDKHQGERCFVIGNGPSLKYEDLERLRNEKTFVSNSFIKILDKLSFKPTYYFVQDALALKANLSYIRKTSGITKFIYSYFNQWRYYVKGAINYISKKTMVGFSDDIVKGVYDGWTVTQSMIQFAVYMGFTEIYLLGVDFNYANNNTAINADCYFDKTMFNNKFNYALPKTETSLAAFSKSREYCDQHGIKIYNATRGGKLEVFERINFDDLFPC